MTEYSCVKCGKETGPLDTKCKECGAVIEPISIDISKIIPEDLKESLERFAKFQEKMSKMLSPSLNPELFKSIQNVAKMSKAIKIKAPSPTFKEFLNTHTVKFGNDFPKIGEVKLGETKFVKASEIPDEILGEVKVKLEERHQIDKLKKSVDGIKNQMDDMQQQGQEQHTENMAEHQKTRDELLIDNGGLREQISNLEDQVKNAWKSPKSWGVGIAVGFISGLIVIGAGMYYTYFFGK